MCRGYGAAAAIGQHVYLVGGGNGSSWLKGAMLCKLDQGSAWSEVTSTKVLQCVEQFWGAAGPMLS